MKFDHVQLVVQDVTSLRQFFEALPNIRISTVLKDSYFEVFLGNVSIGVCSTDIFEASTGICAESTLRNIVLQFSVNNVDEMLAFVANAPGVSGVFGPFQSDWGTRSGFIQHSTGLTIELYCGN